MTKKILLGSAAAMLALALVGGSIALAGGPKHGPAAFGPGNFAGPGNPAALFERFDSDGDGRVSQEDVDTLRAERLAAFDADGDGELSLEEYQALWLDAMHRHMVRAFQRLDTDGDAKVTAEEFVHPFSKVVERFDRDGDGVVTKEELREAAQRRHGPHGERRGDDRPGEQRGQRQGD